MTEGAVWQTLTALKRKEVLAKKVGPADRRQARIERPWATAISMTGTGQDLRT